MLFCQTEPMEKSTLCEEVPALRKNKLYVRMLGDFTLSYAGKRLTLERNGYTKASQLLQYLLYRRGKPVHKDELVRILYEEGEVASPQNNLKVNIFRLRRLLEETGLPSGRYIAQTRGSYAWDSAMEVELDAFQFEKMAREALGGHGSPETRCVQLLRAAEAYTGEFLPMLRHSGWARVEAEKYKELYIRVVREAVAVLEQDGSGDGVRELFRRAATVCPGSEELQIGYISALLDSHRFREARDVHAAAVRTLSRAEEGWDPSPEFSVLERRINGDLSGADEIVGLLAQEDPAARGPRGTFSCSYTSFVSCFNFARRVAARGRQTPYLILCTLTERSGFAPEQGVRQERAADALREAVFSSLHDSDLAARYSTGQFLILVGDISREDCEKVARRLEERYAALTAEPEIRLVTDVAPALEHRGNLEALHEKQRTRESDVR